MRALCAVATAVCLTLGLAGAAAQTNPQQNPNPNERQHENAQEKASNIKDTVDIVSGPNVESLTRNSASLAWTTDKTAASRVMYGTDAKNPSQHAYEPGGSKQHRVQLTNLKPGTTYHYEIETRAGKDRTRAASKRRSSATYAVENRGVRHPAWVPDPSPFGASIALLGRLGEFLAIASA